MVNKDETQIYEKYRLCPKCGGKVPQGYLFCSNCGNAILESPQQDNYASSNTAYKPQEPEVYNSDSKNKKTANNSKKGLVAALIVLCCVLAAGLVFEYSQVMIANDTITHEQQEIRNKTSELASQANTIADLQRQNSDLKKQKEAAEVESRSYSAKYWAAKSATDDLDKIKNFIKNSDAGRGSSRYYAEDKVVVLKKGDAPYKLWIDSNHTSGGSYTISYQLYGNSVYCDWSKENWDTRTYLMITPLSKGTSTLTFTTTYNSDSFKVLVVVYE